jgi:exosortase C (VPDSG-CTERM-specific)
VVFAVPLWQVSILALTSDLYSHIVLIPVVSLYLIWIRRHELPAVSKPLRGVPAIFFGIGGIAVTIYAYQFFSGIQSTLEDRLSLLLFAFVSLLTGLCTTFLGRGTLRVVAFPLGFLIFIVPFPQPVLDAIEAFFQHTSAAAAAMLFKAAGTPFFRQDTYFQLPGINLQVAPECSGIRSSLALFITSLVAGQLFLHSNWTRAALAVVVIPLGIIRNGFRILVIGELCVRVGPHMIDSYVHHHGGPIFFALSLVPFSGLLWWMARSERLAKFRRPSFVQP